MKKEVYISFDGTKYEIWDVKPEWIKKDYHEPYFDCEPSSSLYIPIYDAKFDLERGQCQKAIMTLDIKPEGRKFGRPKVKTQTTKRGKTRKILPNVSELD